MALRKNVRNQSIIEFEANSGSGITTVVYSTDSNPSGASIDTDTLTIYKAGDTTPGFIPNYSYQTLTLQFTGYNECDFYNNYPNVPNPTSLVFFCEASFCRVGRMVTITLPSVTFDATGGNTSDKVMTLNGIVPALFRPLTTSTTITSSYTTSDIPRYKEESDVLGALRINSLGTIEVWRRLTFNDTWNQSQCGWDSISITYVV